MHSIELERWPDASDHGDWSEEESDGGESMIGEDNLDVDQAERDHVRNEESQTVESMAGDAGRNAGRVFLFVGIVQLGPSGARVSGRARMPG